MDKILLGQLDSNGDCLYATILARQLRRDHPTAHITWAISSRCVNVIRNNPDIDDIWEIPIAGESERWGMWYEFETEAYRRYRRKEFDFVLLSQINPSNFHNWDGTCRPGILRSYGRPITVPIENVVKLTSEEVERVEDFISSQGIAKFENRVLFECSSVSGQSFVTPDLAQEIARHIYAELPDTTVIFLTNLPMTLRDSRSKYAGNLSLRECAHLTHHCNLFLGCGSGGTVSASSTASKSIPMLLMLRASGSVFASFAHDFEFFGLMDRPILETTSEDVKLLGAGAVTLLRDGIESAHAALPDGVPLHFAIYEHFVAKHLLENNFMVDAARSVDVTTARYGWTAELLDFAKTRILPRLSEDLTWKFQHTRQFIDGFKARLEAGARNPAPYPRQTPGAGKILFAGSTFGKVG